MYKCKQRFNIKREGAREEARVKIDTSEKRSRTSIKTNSDRESIESGHEKKKRKRFVLTDNIDHSTKSVRVFVQVY